MDLHDPIKESMKLHNGWAPQNSCIFMTEEESSNYPGSETKEYQEVMLEH